MDSKIIEGVCGERKKILVKGEHKPARNIIRVSEFPVSSRVMLPFSRRRAALRASSLSLLSRCRAALRASLRAHARYKTRNRLENLQASLQFPSLFLVLHRLV